MSLGENLRKAFERLKTSSVDKETIKEAIKELQRALISSDVEIALVLKLSKKLEEHAFEEIPETVNRREHILKLTYDALADLLGGEYEIPNAPKKILLVGLQGNGKTTTAAKLAHYFKKRGRHVGLLCGDAFRPAAFEQLKQLSEKIEVPFYGNKNEKNSVKIVKDGLAELEKKQKCNLIIVDSAGRSALDSELTKEITAINSLAEFDEKWLVLGADVGQVAKKQAQAFHENVGVNGVILTRMDGSAKGGGALTACAETNAKVYFIGIGEKINDLESFNAVRYLGRIMGYGDLEALIEKMKEIDAQEFNAEELMEKDFTLETFYQQLKAARQMGPLNKVMDMMGLGAKIPKEMMEVSEQKLDGFKVIMDSMAKKEKNNPELLNNARIERIAKGSGKKPQDVRELLKQFKQMKKIMDSFRKLDQSKLEKEGIEGLLKKMPGMKRKKKKFKIR